MGGAVSRDDGRGVTKTEALAAMSAVPSLLLVCDYDGTLTPIVPHPSLAQPDQTTIEVLERLVGAPRTTVAVVSGRKRSDLEAFLPVAGLVLVGGHGSETGEAIVLDEEDEALLKTLVSDLEAISASAPGALVEVKKTSVAIHYRQVEGGGEGVVARVMTGPARRPGVRVVAGKKVVELSVSRKDKGDAVRHLRRDHPADIACFIGDDVTDEDAFRALEPGDFGIKVGEGETAANLRLVSQAEVVPFLAEIASRRT